ncbi:ribonuclease Z [Jiulongibacter sp. NS-SX5]|uniref:ribonuclease Z n=1 Tax=Jiulongibacter sp. NS-SX5 TaxID=3463854 RepID=UPI004058A959
MKFTVFGIGSATPKVGRNPSAFLLEIENESILIDCGEGTQYRLLEHKIKHTLIKTICISHLHGDHYFGLVGLLSSLSLGGRKEAITLIGPEPLLQIIEIQLKQAGNELSFPLEFIATQNGIKTKVLDKSKFIIETFPLVHRVPCTGFLITQKEGKRHIKPELLPENFPYQFIQTLKEGKDVEDVPNNKVYRVEELTTPGDSAKIFAYCSDTAYFEQLAEYVAHADLVYHEATFTKELEKRAVKTKHSTAEQAALTARNSHSKALVIGHFSSRYKELENHLKEAKEVFEVTFLAVEGRTFNIG